MSTKKHDPGVAMVKNARRRLTCENASNYVHFCRSRCCFAHSMNAKIDKKSSKIHNKITTKNTKPYFAMVKNARRRPTCKKKNIESPFQSRSVLSLPVLLCSRHACKIAQKSENLHTKNPKHIGSTHQNRVKYWIRSIQNQRNSFKIPLHLQGLYGRARREAGQFEVY